MLSLPLANAGLVSESNPTTSSLRKAFMAMFIFDIESITYILPVNSTIGNSDTFSFGIDIFIIKQYTC